MNKLTKERLEEIRDHYCIGKCGECDVSRELLDAIDALDAEIAELKEPDWTKYSIKETEYDALVLERDQLRDEVDLLKRQQQLTRSNYNQLEKSASKLEDACHKYIDERDRLREALREITNLNHDDNCDAQYRYVPELDKEKPICTCHVEIAFKALVF